MGVIAFRCTVTGESFLGISDDIPATFNSTRCKLDSNWHPNRRLLELWNTHGADNFELVVLHELEYEDPLQDHTQELEEIRDMLLDEDRQAQKIWR